MTPREAIIMFVTIGLLGFACISIFERYTKPTEITLPAFVKPTLLPEPELKPRTFFDV